MNYSLQYLTEFSVLVSPPETVFVIHPGLSRLDTFPAVMSDPQVGSNQVFQKNPNF